MPQVLFYKTSAGNDVVIDFIRQQPANDRRVIGEDLKVLEIRYPVGMPLCKPLGNGLWELRSSLPSKREARLLYFYRSKSKTIMVVHGFIKTTRTTPKGDLRLAEKRKKEVE
jgi:phage-related protein